jgi:hypothetical protein
MKIILIHFLLEVCVTFNGDYNGWADDYESIILKLFNDCL